MSMQRGLVGEVLRQRALLETQNYLNSRSTPTWAMAALKCCASSGCSHTRSLVRTQARGGLPRLFEKGGVA